MAKQQQTSLSPSQAPKGNPAPPSQIPRSASFRRQRASRACDICHARKVRCDAASLGVPCTNCVAFFIKCKIPAPKRTKTDGKKDGESERRGSYADTAPSQIYRRKQKIQVRLRSPKDGTPM
ncbi:Transcriptional activator of fatty acid utilization [Elasticomyces elasticus]|nr:Transcriptional activator of fatty acid utilization [Elasticomyces elasticus]